MTPHLLALTGRLIAYERHQNALTRGCTQDIATTRKALQNATMKLMEIENDG